MSALATATCGPRWGPLADEAPRRFVSFATNHGAIWQNFMCPPDEVLTERICGRWVRDRG